MAKPAIDHVRFSAPMPNAESAWASERAVVIGLWMAWVLACLPLLFIRILPAVDYPDHLARIYILAHGLSLPGYAQFYQAHWAFLPNLAFDLIAVPLAKVLPVEVVGRLYVCGLFGLMIFGAARLNKVLTGRWTWPAIVPALLIYNRILAYGFLNYLTGLGLMMLALAFHIEHRQSKPWKRLLIEAAFLVGLFTCHLVAMALYVSCAIAYDIAKWWEDRPGRLRIAADLAVVLAPTAVLLGLFLKFSPTTEEALGMNFREWDSKIKLLHMTFQTGQGVWDLIFGGLTVAFLIWLFATRKVRIDKTMITPILLLCVTFVVSPTAFKQASNVDTRIPLVLSMILFVAVIPLAKFPARPVSACLLGLLAFRCLTTSLHYAQWDRQIAEVIADLDRVPAGSVVLVARNTQSHAFDATSWDPPLMHLDCLLLLDRPILSEDLFTIPSEQPLLKKTPYAEINLTAKVGGSLARNLADYGREASIQNKSMGMTAMPEYVYYVREPGALQLPSELQPVVERERYAIFKVDPGKLEQDHFTLPAADVRERREAEELDRWNMSN